MLSQVHSGMSPKSFKVWECASNRATTEILTKKINVTWKQVKTSDSVPASNDLYRIMPDATPRVYRLLFMEPMIDIRDRSVLVLELLPLPYGCAEKGEVRLRIDVDEKNPLLVVASQRAPDVVRGGRLTYAALVVDETDHLWHRLPPEAGISILAVPDRSSYTPSTARFGRISSGPACGPAVGSTSRPNVREAT